MQADVKTCDKTAKLCTSKDMVSIPGKRLLQGTLGLHGKVTRGRFVLSIFDQLSQGICEKAAENGVLSTAPQTREPRRFKLV